MQVVYSKNAKKDRIYWENNNPDIIRRIDKLLADIREHPFSGIGKPEALKFEKSGYWSRRINQEHRLIYKVVQKKIYILQCRYHY